MSFPPLLGPQAPERNPTIEPQWFQPSAFQISAITTGTTTTITTLASFGIDNNYVVGQLVRFFIPPAYGIPQLNGLQGYVISLPATNQIEVQINSTTFDSFISNPYTSTITNATQATHCVITANNPFRSGQLITIAGVTGMTELNAANWQILSCNATTITINVDSTGFTSYISGGTATLQTLAGTPPQVMAIGDVNTGATNTGRTGNATSIPGRFENISPAAGG